MSSEFHTEVWVGLWNVNPACPLSPIYPVPQSSMPTRDPAKHISASTLLFKPTPCLECSRSPSRLLKPLPSQSPPRLTVPPTTPPGQPAPQGPPGRQEPMLGGFFEHVCRLVFGSSFYTLVLCPQLLRPLAPCFVHSRCFAFTRCLSFPSLLVGQGSLCGIPPARCWGWD